MRDALVLIPIISPSMFIRAPPDMIDSPGIFVSIISGRGDELEDFRGMISVIIPWAMRTLLLLTSAITVCPKLVEPAPSVAGFEIKGLPSVVVVADCRNAKFESLSREVTKALTSEPS